MTPPIKVIFFDAGGTLLRPARPVGETYAAIGRNYGQNWDAVALDHGFRRAFRKMAHGSKEEGSDGGKGRDHKKWWRQVVQDALQDVNAPDHFPFDNYFEELFAAFARPENWRVFPDALEVLSAAHDRGYRLAILSNWDERLHVTLKGLGLTDYFERTLISSELGVEKPHPDIYKRALDLFQIKPEEALMVGDEPMNDYWSPKSCGWHALLLERPHKDLRGVLEWLKI
jgi:putative hydrolase of the HAD superfamily